MIWSGLLKIMERAGLTERLAKLLSRPVGWLLGPEGQGTAICGAVRINVTAKLRGVGDAATPAGLKAMQLMTKRVRNGKATDGMCMFLLINASSLQLIPTTVISLRAASGSADPGAIILPALIGSAAATICAIGLGKWCARVWPV